MKSLRNTFFLLAALLLTCLHGCETEGPAGIDGPWVKGTLEGSIGVYDEHEIPMEDKSGFRVEVASTGLYAETDYDGYYRIDNLPTGTYNISCKKAGFATDWIIGYGFIGGGTTTLSISWFRMVPPSTTTIRRSILSQWKMITIS